MGLFFRVKAMAREPLSRRGMEPRSPISQEGVISDRIAVPSSRRADQHLEETAISRVVSQYRVRRRTSYGGGNVGRLGRSRRGDMVGGRGYPDARLAPGLFAEPTLLV